MHRDWPWLRWRRRTQLAFDALGLIVAIAYAIAYFALELDERAHALIGVGGLVVLPLLMYVTYGAHLATDLSDPETDGS